MSDRLLELVFSAEAADADVGRFVRELAAEADREGLSLVFTTAPKDGQTPKISRELTVDFLRDAAGDIVTRTYEIPYRPQYVLTFAPGAATGQAVAVPTGPWWEHDVPGFRFHLSPEALKLVAAQGADPERGFTRIEVVWDATDAGPVLLKAMQGVTKAQEVTA